MIKLPTDRPASRQHMRHSSRCINFSRLNKCLPAILQFDYHLLLMATFNFDLTDCKSKTTKPDAKFNWKSFYFLVYLIVGLSVNTAECTLVQGASVVPSSSFDNVTNNVTRNVTNDIISNAFSNIITELIALDNKKNRNSQIDKLDLSLTGERVFESAPVPDDSRQPQRIEYPPAAILPNDQKPNQISSATSSTKSSTKSSTTSSATSPATSSTYQIFNSQTGDAHHLSINPKQTPDSANQTNRIVRELDRSIERKSSNERYPLDLPTNLTIRPSLITTYSAERQLNAEAPPGNPKKSSQAVDSQAPVVPLNRTVSTQVDSSQVLLSTQINGTQIGNGTASSSTQIDKRTSSTQVDSNQQMTANGGNVIRTEIESKMRRRFAADNSAEQQKGLNEEDSKNYNQKKRDKMQKMQNYEQQVGFGCISSNGSWENSLE